MLLGGWGTGRKLVPNKQWFISSAIAYSSNIQFPILNPAAIWVCILPTTQAASLLALERLARGHSDQHELAELVFADQRQNF